MTSGEGVDDRFERAWQHVEASWEDAAAHRQFLAFCSAEGALAEAGRRYRYVRDHHPERAGQADLQLNAVLGLAFASMDLAATSRARPRKPRALWVTVGVVLTLVGFVALRVLGALR